MAEDTQTTTTVAKTTALEQAFSVPAVYMSDGVIFMQRVFDRTTGEPSYHVSEVSKSPNKINEMFAIDPASPALAVNTAMRFFLSECVKRIQAQKQAAVVKSQKKVVQPA